MAATPAGFAFLETKFYAPPVRDMSVARPRLYKRLSHSRQQSCTLVSAPAGFGKTTLVREWLQREQSTFTWLSLDTSDGTPVRFLSYLTAALQRLFPGFGEGILAALKAPAPAFDAIVEQLINELAVEPPEEEVVYLVLDDYHLLNAPGIDELCRVFLSRMPPFLHVILITREDPQLPLARWRARGRLHELRAPDLRFTLDEVAAFLNEAMGLTLSTEDAERLAVRTEGWIAGLQLAALSMQGRDDKAGFLNAFSGNNRYIVDYLVEEVLLCQPPEVRSFLLQTSVLRRLCGSLCDALTKQEGGAKLLEELERANVFLIPLDQERHWFRYHHLFGDVLQSRAEREDPALFLEAHRRAASWFAEEGLLDEAIEHAIIAKDWSLASSLLEDIWPLMDALFQTERWRAWAEKLPKPLLTERPLLSMGMSWCFLQMGELEAAERYLSAIEAWCDTQTKVSQEVAEVLSPTQSKAYERLPAGVATARAYQTQAAGDLEACVAYAQRALSLLPEDAYIERGPAASLLSLVHWAQGELDAAFQALDEAMSNFRHSGNIAFALSGTYGLADIKMTQGRLGDALTIYEDALQLANTQVEPGAKGVSELHLGLAALYLEKGRREQAEAALAKSFALGEASGLPDWPLRSRCVKARFHLIDEQWDEALALLEEAEGLVVRTPMPEVRPLAAQKAMCWLRMGALEEALVWMHRCEARAQGHSFLEAFPALVCARIRMAAAKGQDDLMNGAERSLKTWLEQLEGDGHFGLALECRVGLSLLLVATERKEEALEVLRPALSWAATEGHTQLFLDEGAQMLSLLSAIDMASQDAITQMHIKKLLAAFQGKAPTAPRSPTTQASVAAQPLLEPLSTREIEVLSLIAEGLSNGQIGKKLHIALDTVKGHNRNIFGKLQVRRRTEAVARARALGLL